MECERAQPLQRALTDAGGGRSQISRWGLPGGAAGGLCPLRRYERADPARRAEILERRVAGSLFDAGSGAAAALPGQTQARLIAPSSASRNRSGSPNRIVTGSARVRSAKRTKL